MPLLLLRLAALMGADALTATASLALLEEALATPGLVSSPAAISYVATGKTIVSKLRATLNEAGTIQKLIAGLPDPIGDEATGEGDSVSDFDEAVIAAGITAPRLSDLTAALASLRSAADRLVVALEFAPFARTAGLTGDFYLAKFTALGHPGTTADHGELGIPQTSAVRGRPAYCADEGYMYRRTDRESVDAVLPMADFPESFSP